MIDFEMPDPHVYIVVPGGPRCSCDGCLSRYGSRAEIVDEHATVLLDYARRGDRAGFIELATCLGVAKEDHDPMWRGTLRRLGEER